MEALAVARELGPVPGELQPEGRRLGVDAVAAPDGRRVFVLDRAPLQRIEQLVEIVEQDVGSLLELHREAGIEHVARRHPLVHKARIGADMLGDIGQEGDHVVPCLALDLVDPRDLERAPSRAPPRRALRDDAELCLRLARIGLDVEPDAEPVLGLPDRRHVGRL